MSQKKKQLQLYNYDYYQPYNTPSENGKHYFYLVIREPNDPPLEIVYFLSSTLAQHFVVYSCESWDTENRYKIL